MRIAIIGKGKVGTALEKALTIAGHDVVDVHLTPELLFLCVPDDVIAQVSSTYAGLPMVHTSGTNPSSILAGNGPKASMHPIQAIRSGAGADVFHGCGISLEGDESLLNTLETLATEIGGNPLRVTIDQKRVIHLAAVMVSNFTVALHMGADEILHEAGIDQTSSVLFERLMQQTLLNIQTAGAMDARTGPASRGDMETIAKHLSMLDGHPSLKAAYRALSEVLKTSQTRFYSEESGKTVS